MKTFFLSKIALAVLACALLPLPATAKTKVGDEVPYTMVSPRAYTDGSGGAFTHTEEIHRPGATFIRVHFSNFDLDKGDRVEVSSPDGSQKYTYTGRGHKGLGAFWSFVVDGDTAVVSLFAHGGQGQGFQVDRIAQGFLSPEPRQVCGSDGRQDVACYGSGAKSITRPVARLLYQDGFTFVCTGWLVRGSQQNMLMTNQHCIDNQAVLNTLDARFNYQNASCGGVIDDPFATIGGGDFLRTSSSLDYSLMTLDGDPEGLGAGEFIPTAQSVSPGDRFVFPQHPGGDEKEVAVFADSGQSVACVVDSVNQTVGGYKSGSQMYYECDSEGGSSGSPILSVPGLKAIAIHHIALGGFECLNGATHMDEICADAGSLLICD